MKSKKQRGQRRKLKTLKENIKCIEAFQDTSCKFEHFHVPCGMFISSPKTSGKIKTEFCKAWLEKTAEIIEQKPADIDFCKVVALIDEFDFWESQIIIFYDKEYYDSFWNRNSQEQKWNLLTGQDVSFVKKRNINCTLKEKGYEEIYTDEDYTRKTILWFYGEIS